MEPLATVRQLERFLLKETGTALLIHFILQNQSIGLKPLFFI
jgi:hypothetical protein